MFKKKIKGFTLIELLAVIVVLVIISAIGYVLVGDIIQSTNDKKDEINVNSLINIVNNYIWNREVESNPISTNKYYVIKDNVEYTISSNGNITRTDDFKYSGRICNYCTIEINSNREIFILLENKNRDIKKSFSSNELSSIPLTVSREDTSFYNELDLFINIYTSEHIISNPIKFYVEGNKVSNESNELVYTLQNSSGSAIITIESSENFNIEINKDNTIITKNESGILEEKENINSGYSDEILTLYNELILAANNYISSNNITSEEYFEFNNGSIVKKDIYGNDVTSNISMNSINGQGELRINQSKNISVVIYEDGYDIKNDYGSNKLYNVNLTLPRDVRLLFKNLHRLELLAESYPNSATTEDYLPSKSDWLVFYYIRQLKYNSSNWDIVSGKDNNYITYVNNNGKYLSSYFKNIKTLTVNGDVIDFPHMAAVIDTRMYQTASGSYGSLDQGIVDSISSWAGDLQTFMIDDILNVYGSDKTTKEYKGYVLEKLGTPNTKFSLDDMLADVDGWVIYENLCNDTSLDLETAFTEFYNGTAEYSYKKRFTRFISDEVFRKYYNLDAYPHSSGAEQPSTFFKTIRVYTYPKLYFLLFEVKWPLFGDYEIPSNLSRGTTEALRDWLTAKANAES